MGRSRMFGDDPPEESRNPSPRTTIVGGRPPEEGAQTPPVPTGLQKLLRLASVDPGFARELLLHRERVAAAAGVELNGREQAMLQAVPEEQLRDMIESLPPPPEARRDFLRKTAATAVVLLGGAALSGCEDGPSAAPEEPVPFVEERPPGRPERLEGTKGIRPFSQPQPVTGIRPDVPPPPTPAPEGQFAQPPEGWDGGTPPEPPPPRPDVPPPPTGIRPDLPPPPPPKPDGGTVPDEKPPQRPPKPNATRGIRFTDGQE